MNIFSSVLLCALVHVAFSADLDEYFGILYEDGQPFGSAIFLTVCAALSTNYFNWRKILSNKVEIMFRPNRRDGSFTFKVIDQKEYAAQHVIALRLGWGEEKIPDDFNSPLTLAHITNRPPVGNDVRVLSWYEDNDKKIHVEFLDLKAFLEGPNGVYKVRHDKGLSRNFKGCAVIQGIMFVGIVHYYNKQFLEFSSLESFKRAHLDRRNFLPRYNYDDPSTITEGRGN